MKKCVYVCDDKHIFNQTYNFIMKKTIVKKSLTDLQIAPIDAAQITQIKGGKKDRNGFIIEDQIDGI